MKYEKEFLIHMVKYNGDCRSFERDTSMELFCNSCVFYKYECYSGTRLQRRSASIQKLINDYKYDEVQLTEVLL